MVEKDYFCNVKPYRLMRFAFLIFLLLPVAGQAYVCFRTWQLLPAIPALRIAVVALMVVAFVLFFIAMSGTIDHWPMPLATATYEIGTSWLMILLYLFLAFLLLDILRLCHVLPMSVVRGNAWTSAALAIFMTALFVYAYFHFDDKKRVELTLTTDKPLDSGLTLVLVSDLHLGYHNTRADLHRWLQLLKAENPDAILIGGDIIDGSYRPVAETAMAEEFRSLGIPVYACLGNHDYYTGLDAIYGSVRKLASICYVTRRQILEASPSLGATTAPTSGASRWLLFCNRLTSTGSSWNSTISPTI